MESSVQTSDGHISSFSSSSRSLTTDNSIRNGGYDAQPVTDSVVDITEGEVENEDLFPGNCAAMENKGNIKKAVKLYQAALKGDWEAANGIFSKDSSWITKKITTKENTVLHIAAAAKQIGFVEELVKLYCSNKFDLAITNRDGRTALAYAAVSGVVRIAKAIVENDRQKPRNPDDDAQLKYIPLLSAVVYKRKKMASYLFSQTNFEVLPTKQQLELLLATIDSDYYDIALDILKEKSELAKERVEENGDTALHLLARKPNAIGSSNRLSFWKKYINSRFDGIYKTARMQTLAHQVVESLWNFVVEDLSTHELHKFITTPSSLLNDAARVGNVEFLIILIRSYPDLIWIVDEDKKSIFHVAVENRQENVFSLIHEIGGVKDFLANGYNEKNDCNILHLAGKLASPYLLSRVSGTALQMQWELLWFKEVKKIIIPSHCKMKLKKENKHPKKDEEDNGDGLTPRELFTKEHKHLRKEGEEWMKNTANSCMLVATLIATVVFAAAFTVPGGNDDKDGIPIFQKNRAFTVFVISDVAALVMSTTSILIFLSILTSRYAEEDFLIWLPSKLLFGLVTLFVSIACMAVAFSATFFIAYHKTKVRIPLMIAAVTILPIACFCVFHFKLVRDIFRSTYWPRFSLRKHKKRLF